MGSGSARAEHESATATSQRATSGSGITKCHTILGLCSSGSYVATHIDRASLRKVLNLGCHSKTKEPFKITPQRIARSDPSGRATESGHGTKKLRYSWVSALCRTKSRWSQPEHRITFLRLFLEVLPFALKLTLYITAYSSFLQAVMLAGGSLRESLNDTIIYILYPSLGIHKV